MVVAGELSPEGRLLALINAFRCMVRFLGLVGTAHYLRQDVFDDQADAALRACFSPEGKQMYDGDWIRILRESVRPYAEDPQNSTIPGLVAFLFHRGKELTPEARVLEDWGHFRNKVHHPELEKDSVKVRERLTTWLPALTRTLRGLTFLSRYELLQPIKVSLNPTLVRSARVFRGPALTPRYLEDMSLPLTAAITEPEQSVLWVSVAAPQQQLNLSPFARVTEDGVLVVLREIFTYKGVYNASYVVGADGRDAGRLIGTPHGETHFKELATLIARLGDVGIRRRPTPLKARGYRVGEDPWTAVERWGAAWVRSDYSYEIILELGVEEELKDAIANVSGWTEPRTPAVEGFCLLAAVHYRLSWLAWAKRAAGNAVGARSLLFLLDVGNRYHRPRLRALYALQGFKSDLVPGILAERAWNENTVAIVEKYVLTGRVKEYMRYVASLSGPHPLPLRAEEVLSEIEPSGGGGIDLPLGPDLDEETRDKNA
jgi:hypothetical protein